MHWRRLCAASLLALVTPISTRAFSAGNNLRAMNALDRIVVDKTEDFDKALESAMEQAGDKRPLYLLFFGDWCPDCRAARPVIEESLSRIRPGVGALLLEANVAREEYKGNPSYPYRLHHLVQLTCIPTLIKLENGAIKSRLGDTEAHVKEKVDDLVHGDFAGL